MDSLQLVNSFNHWISYPSYISIIIDKYQFDLLLWTIWKPVGIIIRNIWKNNKLSKAPASYDIPHIMVRNKNPYCIPSNPYLLLVPKHQPRNWVVEMPSVRFSTCDGKAEIVKYNHIERQNFRISSYIPIFSWLKSFCIYIYMYVCMYVCMWL